ncbi:MAG: hypothetical protein KKD77_23595, partial [Gammaproteobacteria bacterium]|nr:hypothetical protein [Gammaproteobacteria bacterium]
MIKVCKEPGDLSPIFHLKDKFDSTYVSCSRSEFFQFLVENVKNDRVRIIIDLGEDEKTAKGYVVCVNAVIPPLSNCIAMTYSFSGPGCDMDTIIRRIAKWGK